MAAKDPERSGEAKPTTVPPGAKVDDAKQRSGAEDKQRAPAANKQRRPAQDK